MTIENLNIPNLDCMSVEDLNELSRVFYDLSVCAEAKASAIPARLRGNIPLARSLEHKCNKTFAGLPDYARW